MFVAVDDVGDVARAKADGKLAVAFDLEGGVPLCGRTEMVQLFYDLGVRQIHLAYNRNNAIGGGCYDDVPLSPLGGRIVAAINRAGMLMDCSHTPASAPPWTSSPHRRPPVFFSHSNPLSRRRRPAQHPQRTDRGLCRRRRRHLRRRRRANSQ